jgi:hypothetical protein
MPVHPEKVMMRPVKGKEVLKPEDQTTLRSGVGKLMYQMQYLRPDNLAQYMSCGNLKMLGAIKRYMRYVLCTREAGLLLKPS